MDPRTFDRWFAPAMLTAYGEDGGCLTVQSEEAGRQEAGFQVLYGILKKQAPAIAQNFETVWREAESKGTRWKLDDSLAEGVRKINEATYEEAAVALGGDPQADVEVITNAPIEETKATVEKQIK